MFYATDRATKTARQSRMAFNVNKYGEPELGRGAERLICEVNVVVISGICGELKCRRIVIFEI